MQYLDLLELAIGDGLHGKSHRPLQFHGRRHVWYGKLLNRIALSFQYLTGLTLCLPVDGGWPEKGDTMLSIGELRNFRDCIETVVEENVLGNIVECGVWRGGSCVYAKAVLNFLDAKRSVFGFDSFDGLPRPGIGDDPQDRHHTFDPLSVPLSEVLFRASKYRVGEINWRKGLFCDSLPRCKSEVGTISVLRCDGDMYSSTIDILTNLYPQVSPGGFIIIDDYALEGCRIAVWDYFKCKIPMLDSVGTNGAVMFRKT
jgi:hypothetical protein